LVINEKNSNNIILSIFTSSAYASSCPMMAKSIDDKIAEENLLRFTI